MASRSSSGWTIIRDLCNTLDIISLQDLVQAHPWAPIWYHYTYMPLIAKAGYAQKLGQNEYRVLKKIPNTLMSTGIRHEIWTQEYERNRL